MNSVSAKKQQKRQAYRYGHIAESWCRLWLTIKGYRILERRYRNHYGEIDMIAQKGDALIFVEVKARVHMAQAAESLRTKQQMRIMRAALDYVGKNRKYTGLSLRFDLMVVGKRGFGPIPIIHHIPHAFQDHQGVL